MRITQNIPSSCLAGTKTEYKITVGPWPFSDQNTGLTNQTCDHSATNFLVEIHYSDILLLVHFQDIQSIFKWLTKFHIGWSLCPSNVK